MIYSGPLQNISLSAVATDSDGYVQQVAFYVNGELVGTDTSSPYEASYDVNGSGIYEVYAVASDDDGNDITSSVQRIKVLEPGDVVEPLVLSASASTYLGGMADVSALYKSPTGLGYANALAHVYVNGEYAGLADKLPRTEPGPGEEDPGQGFTYDLPATNLGGYEVELIIVNGDETFTALTQVSVNESPLTDNLEYLKALYLGMFDREPTSSEYKRYFYKLEDGSMTREQVITDLRTRESSSLHAISLSLVRLWMVNGASSQCLVCHRPARL